MTDDQRKRFDEMLMQYAHEKGGLTLGEILVFKEAFWSVEIERPTMDVETVSVDDEGK